MQRASAKHSFDIICGSSSSYTKELLTAEAIKYKIQLIISMSLDITKASIRRSSGVESRAQFRDWLECDDETFNVGDAEDEEVSKEFPSTERSNPVLDFGLLFNGVKPPATSSRRNRQKPSKQKRHTNQQLPINPKSEEILGKLHNQVFGEDITSQDKQDMKMSMLRSPMSLPTHSINQGFESSLGPAPRRTFVIRSETSSMLALVIYTAGEDMQVASVISGRFLGVSRKNQIKLRLQEEVRNRTSRRFLTSTLSLEEKYGKTCDAFVFNQKDFVQILDGEKELPAAHTGLRRMDQCDLLQGAFERAKLHLEPAVNDFELFAFWLYQDGLHGPSYDFKEAEKSLSATCLVCFDEIPKGCSMSKISSCGHLTCQDCWCAYLRSASMSGNTAKLQCCAPNCKESVNLLDAAHLLFSGEKCDAAAKTSHEDTFDRLVENELEHFSKTSSTCSRGYCPSPLCGRRMVAINRALLADNQKRAARNSGWNILLCLHCGSTRCADCPASLSIQSAHPGMTCSVYAEHRKRLDRGTSEAESLCYLIKRTRPCPRCQFAIEKDGGCNHVACQRCTYYFCWQCGGPGNDCQSFYCAKTNNMWHQMSSDSDYGENRYDSLSSLVRKYRDYRQAESRLTYLRKSISKLSEKDILARRNPIRYASMVVEQQIQQVIVWLLGVLVHKENLDERSCEELQRLRLAIQAIEIRLEIREKRLVSSNSSSGDSLPLEDVENALKRRGGTNSNRPRDRRKQERQRQRLEQNGFSALMAGFDLKEMCCLSEEKFHRVCQNHMKEALLSLRREQQESPAKYCSRRRRRHQQRNYQACPLNQKKTSTAPWQQGLKRHDEGSSESKQDDEKVAWKKGKTRVKTQRYQCLDSSNDS